MSQKLPIKNKSRDLYSFGSIMPGREYSAQSIAGYRFGFNGKEIDDETSGNGNIYDYGFRIYNSRLGKFLSIDPLTSSYPWYTPYQFAGNTPISAIDLDGLEEVIVNIYRKFDVIYLITADFVKKENRTVDKPYTYVEVNREDYSKEHRNENGNKTNWGGSTVKTVDDKTPPPLSATVNKFGFAGSGTHAAWMAKKVDIHFETDVSDKSMKLNPKDEVRLKQFAVILLVEDKFGLNINSFTDESGEDIYNQKLSEERAKYAKDYIINFLTSKGVGADKIKEISNRIYAKGNGEIKDGKLDNPDNRKTTVEFCKPNGTPMNVAEGEAITDQYMGNK